MGVFKKLQRHAWLLGMILATSSYAAPFRVLILGPPGAGKGTLAEKLSKHYRIPVLTASQLLAKSAKSNDPESQAIHATMRQGKLVSDKQISDLVAKEVMLPGYINGYILDGFPRTLGQAERMRGAFIDLVVKLEVPDEVIVKRMSGRRVHKPSGRVYHVEHNPPKIAGVDDVTGEKLVLREDDKAEVVAARLKVYAAQTEPVVRWAQREEHRGLVGSYVVLDGSLSISAVWENLVHDLPPMQAIDANADEQVVLV